MSEPTEKQPSAGERQAPPAVGPAVAPKTPAAINVEETRDEFIRNAPPVADALRKRERGGEAAQLEQAAKVIGLAVGSQSPQPTPGDALQGESVSSVLKNIWDVIEQDPELKKLPQAQSLRKASQALDGAGLLTITIRDGIIVSFVSNFADNFTQAQKAGPKPIAKPNAVGVLESALSTARAQQPALIGKSTPAGQQALAEKPAATVPQETAPQVAPAHLGAPAAETKPASLLTPEVLQKARALYQENNAGLTQAGTGFTREDLPVLLLEKMGVKLDELEQSGQLHKLLRGQKTDLISSFSLRNEQGEPVPFAAKLVLRRDAAGAPSLQFDLPKHRLVVPEQILGKEITPQMKEQLTRHGVVPLSEGFRDGQGQSFAAYVAIDQEMNRVVAVRRDGIALPKVVLGVPLTPQQSEALLEGRPTKMEALTNGKGQLFDATVVLDPVKRVLAFRDVQPHGGQEKTEKVEWVAARPQMRG
ncbi:DUF4099 domain-containing protein [Hymenobacter sp. BT491]|uniref:DUF4099 domain-containing protein n=1 Tax=Hymenobacter sp. BT491 TaxID=2766779 RepID=UPI0016539D62|nr:DUF3945 domain-containing protein [Hymenobacter sp. BT491]MBC6992513.1 DUF3945 domain-containing protein [Hymenobacter sp. BT491]